MTDEDTAPLDERAAYAMYLSDYGVAPHSRGGRPLTAQAVRESSDPVLVATREAYIRLARVVLALAETVETPDLVSVRDLAEAQEEVCRDDLIRVGAEGISPAYGPATIRKATVVVDALLSHYHITKRSDRD